MGEIVSADHLLEERGTGRDLDAYVVGAAFESGGAYGAVALGDGTVHIIPSGNGDWRRLEVHDGGVLTLAPDYRPGGFLTGGDDGKLRRLGADGSMADLAAFGGKWVEKVTSFADAKAGLVACSVGKTVHVLGADGRTLKSLNHPSTVTGIAFDAKGKRIAASHYNGASLWFVNSKTDNPRKLEWKGSHIGIALNPAGDAVVTAMQENALHGWRLTDGQHMQMAGYPAKTESLSFSRNGKWLASSGADAIVLWPFFAGGPAGKPPLELAGGQVSLCTRVACHPLHDAVAAGFADGMVVLADLQSERILPVAAAGRGKITALCWSPDGTHILFGTENGYAAMVDFSKR